MTARTLVEKLEAEKDAEAINGFHEWAFDRAIAMVRAHETEQQDLRNTLFRVRGILVSGERELVGSIVREITAALGDKAGWEADRREDEKPKTKDAKEQIHPTELRVIENTLQFLKPKTEQPAGYVEYMRQLKAHYEDLAQKSEAVGDMEMAHIWNARALGHADAIYAFVGGCSMPPKATTEEQP